MDLHQKIRTLPTSAGVYLYKNAEGKVIYVGKANNLRSRVRSYFLEGAAENAKTGTLLREAVDLDYIVVDNEKEALALENNLIKQKKPRYNILLRDDKSYPYIKLTMAERYPRVYATRRLRKDGSLYFGPYFPTSLANRLVDLISSRRSHSPELSDSLVHHRLEPQPSAAVPAVLHWAMSRPLRRRTHHVRPLRRSGTRREALSGGPRRRLVALPA